MDFQRIGVDLGEACWGDDHFGVRRIRDLIAHLGPDSAIAQEMGWSWDDMREMTATLIDLTVNKRRKKGASKYRYPRPEGLKKTKSVARSRPRLSRSGIAAALKRR